MLAPWHWLWATDTIGGLLYSKPMAVTEVQWASKSVAATHSGSETSWRFYLYWTCPDFLFFSYSQQLVYTVLGIIGNVEMIQSPWESVHRLHCKSWVAFYHGLWYLESVVVAEGPGTSPQRVPRDLCIYKESKKPERRPGSASGNQSSPQRRQLLTCYLKHELAWLTNQSTKDCLPFRRVCIFPGK